MNNDRPIFEKEEDLLLCGEWFPILRVLPAKDFRRLILAMYDYINGGETPLLEGEAESAARFVFSSLQKKRRRSEIARRAVSVRWDGTGAKAAANRPSGEETRAASNENANEDTNENTNVNTDVNTGVSAGVFTNLPNGKESEKAKEKETEKESAKEKDKEKAKEKAKETQERRARKDLPGASGDRALEAKQGPVRQGAPRFSPPPVEEVRAYCALRKNSVSADDFCDFYASKGWKVGSEPMRDWKAAVRTWERRRERERCAAAGVRPPEERDRALDRIFSWGCDEHGS